MNLIRRTGSPMTAYRPNSMEDQFGRMVETMFEDFFAPAAQAAAMSRWPDEATSGTSSPRLNVTEDDKSFQVQAEMPGVKKEDVKVSIDRQRVTIEAETRQEQEKREGENLVYAERTARKFMRSFMLPTEVDDAGADARLEDGVLSLSLPKKQAGGAKRLTIQ
jgi:HSP20 family protein